MKKLLLLFTLACLSISTTIFAEGVFTGYPSSTTALAYDGQYFWIGQEYKVLKWDKNAGILAEYTPKDGLPGSLIREIYIAPDRKTIWAASDSSVARFDGTSWHTFTVNEGVSSGPLGNTSFERDGSIWILTKDGTGVFRYNGNTWKHFTSADGLASDTVYAVAVDTEGVVWVGTDKGVSAYDGTIWKSYTSADGLSDNVVTRILVDKNNVKWFGIGGEVGGVARFDGSTWMAYNTTNGKVQAKSIKDMALGPDNSMYVSLWDTRYLDYGDPGYPPVLCKTALHVQKISNPHPYDYTYLYRISEGEVSLIQHHVADGFGYDPSVNLSPLIVDNSGKLYILSDNPYDQKAPISGYDGKSPVCDSSNTIWYIEESWLASNHNNDFHGYGFGPPPATISALAVCPGNGLWVGDPKGSIAQFVKNTWKISPYKYSPFGSTASLCLDMDGKVWGCGDTSKLTVFQWDQSETLETPLPNLYARSYWDFFAKSVSFDHSNTLWVSFVLKPSQGVGVYSYDGSTWTQYTFANGLIDNTVNAIAIDSADTKWFGTSAGISRYDGSTWTSFPTAENCSPVGNVNVLAAGPTGILWAGTSNGLLRYDGASWSRFTPKEGLADTLVLSLAVGGNGVVWAGTPIGLSRYDGKSWKTFTVSDGLPSNRVQALAVDHNGVVWIGTDEGLVSYAESEGPNFVSDDTAMPSAFPLLSVYPNPFNPSTIIECTLPVGSKSELAVYALTGQKIRTLASEYLPSGKHQFRWDGKDDSGQVASSGVYVAKLKAGNFSAASKMVLVK